MDDTSADAPYPIGTDKKEWPAQVQELIARDQGRGDPDVVAALLCWLMDYCWPGAREAFDYLRSLGGLVLPHALEVLKRDDTVWSYNVMLLMESWPDDVLAEATPVLLSFARGDDDEGANVRAAEILGERRLISHADLAGIVEHLQGHVPHQDLDELRSLLAS